MADFLTIKEFAANVGYSERRIRQFCIDGKINANKLGDKGRKWLISNEELEWFKESGSKYAFNKQHDFSQKNHPVSEAKNKHFADMTDIIHFLTPQWFEAASGDLELPESLTDDQLRCGFLTRLEQARMKFGDKRVQCLESHLRAYLPALNSEDVDMLLENEPHKMYEQLWLIGQRGVSKGNCPICTD
jgi:excisionase family DNA binding protein